MNEQDWLKYAKDNREKLVSLIDEWHPRSLSRVGHDMKITAPNAERACENVRQGIRARSGIGNPVEELNKALDLNNWQAVNTLLNDAWFGVPESTSCWKIVGFKEAVYLMEDMPYDGEEKEG